MRNVTEILGELLLRKTAAAELSLIKNLIFRLHNGNGEL